MFECSGFGHRQTPAAPPRRAHRTVVLPEWQGLGIGSRLSDAAAEWHARRGSDYYGQTAHPRFGAYRDGSSLWEPTEANHTAPLLRWLPRRLTGASHEGFAVRRRQPRTVFAHRYIGTSRRDGEDGEDAAEERRRFLDSRVRVLLV